MNMPLIVPVPWKGQTITSLAFERLTDDQIAEMDGILQRVRSARRSCVRCVAVATGLPVALVRRLSDLDLERAGKVSIAEIFGATARRAAELGLGGPS